MAPRGPAWKRAHVLPEVGRGREEVEKREDP